MLRLLLFIFLTFISFFGFAQNIKTDTGKVEIIQDAKVKELLAKELDINTKTTIKGYRVKIHFGADKNKANEIKSRFVAQHPETPAYLKYDQPNFNIRVGDFRTKLEAYKFLKEIQDEFPSAFIVQDDIEFPSLIQEEKKISNNR